MSSEQRQSYRLRVPEHLEHAVLRVAGRTVRVRLVDESAGGFAIALPEPMRTPPGAVLRLRTAAGWHEVQVIHCVPCEGGVIIGLVRLQDLEDPRYSQNSSGAFGSLACVGLGIVLMIFVVNSLARYTPPAAPPTAAPAQNLAVSQPVSSLSPALAK